MIEDNRRFSKRISVDLPIIISSPDNFIKGFTVDISKTGILIKMSILETLEVGREYLMNINFESIVKITPKWQRLDDNLTVTFGCVASEMNRDWYQLVTEKYYKAIYNN